MKNNVFFSGTIHPLALGTQMADGVNCVSQTFILKTKFNGKNTIREQKSSYHDLASFCQDFQGMWEEHLTQFPEFMHEGESEGTMHLYHQEWYGKLTLSDEGVRLFKNEDGWTMLVALNLSDLTPFKVYKAIGRCLNFMEDHTEEFPEPEVQDEEFLEDEKYFTEIAFNDVCKYQRLTGWEDDLIHRAERKYKEWLEKKESDIINNNKDDQDCPF